MNVFVYPEKDHWISAPCDDENWCPLCGYENCLDVFPDMYFRCLYCGMTGRIETLDTGSLYVFERSN